MRAAAPQHPFTSAVPGMIGRLALRAFLLAPVGVDAQNAPPGGTTVTSR